MTVVTLLSPLPVSVLDLATVAEGSSPREALLATVAHAQLADELGLTRFWVAEHHNMAGIASSAPAVVIAAIAARTPRIRVGSGGVMLPNHAPLVIAEQFGTLEALHPGRIDLGIGRAPGTDRLTMQALRRGAGAESADEFPRQLAELLALFDGDDDAGIRATPGDGAGPPVWLLGSSGYSAQLAGLLGLPFSFAHHFSSGSTEQALDVYRRSFRASPVLDRPYVMLPVQVLCADDDHTAEALALPAALSFLRLRSGRPGRMPTPVQAAAHPWTNAEREAVALRQEQQAIGSPQTVAERIAELLRRTAADELMVTAMVHDPADRLRSLRLVRSLFGDEPLPLGYAGSPEARFRGLRCNGTVVGAKG